MRRGGDYEHAETPRTDWEWGKQFPELQTLLGGYFHQDFSRFYASHREALDDFLDANGSETIDEASKEIGSFLTSVEDDSELEQAAQILGLQVYPPENVPLRRWLRDILGILQHQRP
ncbi:contact-dependent growth inhibition system immunity protein [Streptomyces sp. AcE210]|uniref:contact-dependent growth inhibition system immunity protein n=1 Tax=Streptomyces sp. AcE210 TaxID=2292703 RepID=UPI000E30A149|nr:contact-dependent growth inhibition system immunity protein [Streptomyces sp. AcE210]RFC77343.1 hypothetical protein DXZ75_05090 [Streptomyces sp. AcE210]